MTEAAHNEQKVWMQRALALAEQGQFWASPNPAVGCVLVRDGHVIGEGFTQPAGQAHAEVMALRAAGDAHNATAYVTLEPCSHQGKTGPCAEALIDAGIRRVVVAIQDPNPQVSGRGLARLREAGIEVITGVEAEAAQAQLAGFCLRMTRGYGRVRAKLAMSVDGRTAMSSGESQWITGPQARQDVQLLRARSCAIVTGIGTVLADDCALTVRGNDLPLSPAERERALYRKPLRVVMDSQLQTPATAKVLRGGETVLCHRADVSIPAALLSSGCRMQPLPTVDGRLDLSAMLHQLGRLQANEILVESGPRLAGAMLQQGLLDELIIYMAPTLMGSEAKPLLDLPIARMADKVAMRIADMTPVGQDWRLRCELS